MPTDAASRRRLFLRELGASLAENAGLKLTSLLIAMALFGMTRGAGTVQRSLEVSLLARLPSPTARRVLLTDLPDKVRLTLRGSPALVTGVRPESLGPVQIDLSDGRRPSVNFEPGLFQLPAGVQLTLVQPPSLQLTWDTLVERDVPVAPQVRGAPAAGTRVVGEPQVLPPTVRVSGPSLFVEGVASVRTDEVDITGLGAGTHERRVLLDVAREHVRYEHLGTVRVRFAIEQEIEDRRFERLPLTAEGTASATLRPNLVAVTLRGAPAGLRALAPSQLVPTVDVGEAGSTPRGTVRAPVHLPRLPEGTELVRIEPPDVLVVYGH